jgi:hypothetical protein
MEAYAPLLFRTQHPKKFFDQLLPVLVCFSIDGVLTMPDPGVLPLVPCRFFSFFAHRTTRMSACRNSSSKDTYIRMHCTTSSDH